MKTIHIKKGTDEQIKKTLCIAGDVVTFASKRELNRAIAQINRDSTLFLIELNEMYIQLFSEYRRAWFQMKSYRGMNYRTENAIRTQLDFVANRFDHLTSYEHSAFILFVDLKKICLFLQTAADELAAFYRTKNNTMPAHGIDIIKKRLVVLTAEIVAYRVTDCNTQ